MARYLITQMGVLLLALLNLQAAFGIGSSKFGNARLLQEEGLSNAYFWNFVTAIYEKEIILGYVNPNENSQTEIWISRSPDDGFVLARVEGPAQGYLVYYDDTRSPRTTYYFKVRAIRGDLKSDFSSVMSFTTGSEFFPPEIAAEATGPGTIEITFYDRSYNDVSYTIWKEGAGPEFRKSFSAPDSGLVFHFKDEFLEPNQTYVYWVDAYTEGPNMPRYMSLVHVTVSLPESLLIRSYLLVDADTDHEVGYVYDGAVIIPPEHPNIVAEASPGTGSVAFFLDGIKRIENEAPYSFFYDIKGDFKAGKLEPGEHELVATPYTGNNGEGIPGATSKINFTVKVPEGSLDIENFTLVDPNTGLDIKELRDGDLVDASVKANIRANTGDKASSVVFFLNGMRRTENEAPYAYFGDVGGVFNPGRLAEGPYVLEATAYSGNNATGAQGNKVTIAFAVAENEMNTFSSVQLYPNPIVNTSVIEILGHPEGSVRLEIIDQYGQKNSLLFEGRLGNDGYLRKSMDVRSLTPGNYIMLVSVEDKVTTKRFSVK